MKIIKSVISFIRKGLDDNIMVYAAQSAYYLMLSSIPFIMILFSIVQLISPLNSLQLEKAITGVVSPSLRGFAEGILDELFKKPGISIISFSAVTILWSASRGFASMERGVKHIYNIPKRRFFILDVIASFIYTIVFAAILLLCLGVIVFGQGIVSFLNNHLKFFAIDINIIIYALVLLLAILIFTLIYMGFSGGKISFFKNLPGAMLTGIGWVVFSFAFSIYINNFSNYSRIYGSLTAVVLMMLWLYICMAIFLFGAELNKLIIKYKERGR